jgi:hypothetical protein
MGAGHSSSSSRSGGGSAEGAARAPPASSPQIRCYQCEGIFTTSNPGQNVHHVRCPYCSTINGVPGSGGSPPARAAQVGAGTSNNANSVAALNAAAAAAVANASGDLSPAALARQEQLLRRLQSREITPLELLILREFVEHLQQTRTGASTGEIDAHTASWVVEDISKLPEELRSCCVCLEDVCVGERVRTLPCLHTFHAQCAEEWLQKKKVCPLCQFAIDGGGEGGSSAEGGGGG